MYDEVQANPQKTAIDEADEIINVSSPGSAKTSSILRCGRRHDCCIAGRGGKAVHLVLREYCIFWHLPVVFLGDTLCTTSMTLTMPSPFLLPNCTTGTCRRKTTVILRNAFSKMRSTCANAFPALCPPSRTTRRPGAWSTRCPARPCDNSSRRKLP